MNKYVKVMFGSKSGASKNINYKIDEVNIVDTWNPNTFDPKDMGGFNFSTYDKVFRWIIRGDTLRIFSRNSEIITKIIPFN